MQMQNIEALEGQALLRSNELHSAEILVKDLGTVINQIALAEEEGEL